MNRNLSDCAAMACLPAAAVASVALPKGIGEDYAKRTLSPACERPPTFLTAPSSAETLDHGTGKLAITVTILGRARGSHTGHLRSGSAKPGDIIFVTGPLGGSILGRHLDFMPTRIELARRYRTKFSSITSMIDLSDGLSRDLEHHLHAKAASEHGHRTLTRFRSTPTRCPIAFRQDHRSPLEHALHDGEDYELLFTIEPDSYFKNVVGNFGVTMIGRITAEPEILAPTNKAVRTPLTPQGWEHSL